MSLEDKITADAVDVEKKIEAEFDALKAKLSKAINDYDHRLMQHFDTAKANVLAHFGIKPDAVPPALPPTKTP